GDHNRRESFVLSSSGRQLRGLGDEQRSDADRERGGGSTDDHDTTCKPDGNRRTDREFHGNSEWDCTAELPVAEEWCQHQRGDVRSEERRGDKDRRRWW